jgi:hypothetical protein
MVFFGEGFGAYQLRYEQTPHNAYLEILFLWGIGGFAIFTFLVLKSLKWSKSVLDADPDSCCRGLAWGFRWSFVAIAVVAMMGDPWLRTYYRCTIFFMLAVMNSRFLLLRQYAYATPLPAAANPMLYPTQPSVFRAT